MSFSDNYNINSEVARFSDVASAFDALAGGLQSTLLITSSTALSALSPQTIRVSNTLDITVTLPDPSTCLDKVFRIIKQNFNASTVTIETAAGEIRDAHTLVLRERGDFQSFISNGNHWLSISSQRLTNIRTWTPTAYGGSGSMTWTSVTASFNYYAIQGDLCFIGGRFSGTTGGTASNTLIIEGLPMPIVGASALFNLPLSAYVQDAGLTAGMAAFRGSTQTLEARKADGSNFALSTARLFAVQGVYLIR